MRARQGGRRKTLVSREGVIIDRVPEIDKKLQEENAIRMVKERVQKKGCQA